MSDAVIDAANDLERMAMQLHGIVALGGELKRVGSLRSMGEEAQTKLDATMKRQVEADAKLLQTSTRINEAEATVKAKMAAETARQEAQITDLKNEISRLNASADAILSNAKKQANDLVDEAKNNSKKIIDEAEVKVASMQPSIDAAQGLLDDTNKELAVARSSLAEINSQIDEIAARLPRR